MGGDDRLKFGGGYSFVRFAPNGSRLAVVTSDTPDVIRLHESTEGEEKLRIARSADGAAGVFAGQQTDRHHRARLGRTSL